MATFADLIAAGGSEVMADAILEAQQLPEVDVFGVVSQRVPYGQETRFADVELPPTCRDCGTPLGWLHVPACMVESCPRCKVRQAFGCPCGTAH